jgi:hypothetical protein
MTAVSISNLEPQKLRRFDKTFRRVLASKEAEHAFAEIIDGLPTRISSMRCGGDFIRPDILDRDEPCASSVLIFRQFRERLEIGRIQVLSQVRPPSSLNLT